MPKTPDLRLQILRLLRLRDEQGPGPLAEIDDLVEGVEASTIEVRRACATLEVTGHVDATHSFDDSNPGYYITDIGKAFLYDLDHK